MTDLISRQAAIDAILAVTGNSSVRELYEHVQEHGLSDMWSGGVNAAIDVIIAVPSAQPEPQWIPCSERLPEVGRSALFSRRSMGTREGCLQADGKWWQYRWNEMLNADQVTAWKPLPEPYKEDT